MVTKKTEVKKVEAAKPVVKAPVVEKKVATKKPTELQRLNVLERKVAALEAKNAKACAKKK